jgi:hypothetical protein
MKRLVEKTNEHWLLLLPGRARFRRISRQLAVLDELRKGIKPTIYTLNGFYPQKGESVIWAFSGVQHLHQAAHSEWVGRSGGLSVRVMKGVWYRSGRNHGHSEHHSSMDDQGVGMLVLTTKALCFVGVNSARLPFAHILALETFSNGIALARYAKRNGNFVLIRFRQL